MSAACKCDRCGILYEYNYKLYLHSYYIGKSDSPNKNMVLDLCPDCQKKLVEWFNDGKQGGQK